MQAAKPADGSTTLVIVNEGESGVPLSWHLSSVKTTDNTTEELSFGISPASGNLSAGKATTVILTLSTANLQARERQYHAAFELASNSFTNQSILIHGVATISALPSANDSFVALLNEDDIVASGSLKFMVAPVDSTGRNILDASAVSFNAEVVSLSTSATIKCSIFYVPSTGLHEGDCALPVLTTGAFRLNVFDSVGATIGAEASQFMVAECPVTYTRMNETCRCEAGFFNDNDLKCSQCPIGTFTNEIGALKCESCDFPQTSNPERTACTVCFEGYYRDASDECRECPDEVTCIEGSDITGWSLLPGYWRAAPSSKQVLVCRFGEASCPGAENSADAIVCPDQSDDPWPYCSCGYSGPMCAVCAPDYMLSSAGKACDRCDEVHSHAISFLAGGLLIVILLLALGTAAKKIIKALKSFFQTAVSFYLIGSVKFRTLFFTSQARLGSVS